MLNEVEFEQIKTYSGSGKSTVKSLLEYIKTNFVKENPLAGNRNTSVHVINKNKQEPVDLTRKRELKGGFKVRTEGESEVGDSVRKGR